MLLKVLFLLILAYLAMRAIMNLFRAIWTEPASSARLHKVPPAGTRTTYQAPPARTARRAYDVEVEDAQFVDLEEEKRR